MSYDLFICRHAQAQEPDFHQTDHDRKLTSNGILEAEKAGSWFQQLAVVPDLIVCSSAQRTRSTATLIATKLAYDPQDILVENILYNATESKLLDYLTKLSKQVYTVVLVGHNPGVSDLVGSLSGKYVGNVPTGSVHYLQFNVADWQELLVTTASTYAAYRGE